MEKNRKILKDALRNLPVYQPEDRVWDRIEVHLNKSLSLDKLGQLRKFEPPKSVWDNIDEKLTRNEKLSTLPKYNPPEKVWESIDRSLSNGKDNQAKNRIIKLVKWTSAAAAIFILGFFVFTKVNTDNRNISYSEEWVELQDMQQWDEGGQMLENTLVLICEENPVVCKSPEFKKMKADWEFLNKSKQAILMQLSKYDTNTELEIMLTEIELEQTSLIKEMIANTI